MRNFFSALAAGTALCAGALALSTVSAAPSQPEPDAHAPRSLATETVVDHFSNTDQEQIREVLADIEQRCPQARSLELIIAFRPEESPENQSSTVETVAETFPNLQVTTPEALHQSRDELFEEKWEQMLKRSIMTPEDQKIRSDRTKLRISLLDALLPLVREPWYASDGVDVVFFYRTPHRTSSKNYAVDNSLRGHLIHEVVGHLVVDEFHEQARRTIYHEFEAANKSYLQGRSPDDIPDRSCLENWVSCYAKNGGIDGRAVAETFEQLLQEILTVKDTVGLEEQERFEELECYIDYVSRTFALHEDVAETVTYVLLDCPYPIGATVERKVRAVQDFLRLIAEEE